MERIAKTRVRMRIGAVIAIAALAALAAGPARAILAASSQLCYGTDCSEMGYDVYQASVSDSFQRWVGAPGPTGYFNENATADAAPRQVTFDVDFLGGELIPDPFLGSTPQRPYGSLVLIAFMGATGEDELTITAPGLAHGFVSIDIQLEAGGINGCTAVSGCSTGLPFVSPNLDGQFWAQVDGEDAGSQILTAGQMTAVGGFSQLYQSSQIPFTAGTPFEIRMGVSGTMGLHALLDPNPPESFVSGSSLGITATIVQLHVFDASHAPLAGASIASATGTDWTTVPEASEVASEAAAVIALGLVARRGSR